MSRERERVETVKASLQAKLARQRLIVTTSLRLPFEPPRVCRRPFGLSYAAMAGCSSMA